MSIITEFSSNWKDLNNLLVYQSKDFDFHQKILIVDLENCLIKKIGNSSLYHLIEAKEIELYNSDFINKLKHQSQNNTSIVIISNQLTNNKLLLDSIKRKLESFLHLVNFKVLAFFILKANVLSKPHTGCYRLLTNFYKKNMRVISEITVISDMGGRVITNYNKAGKTKMVIDRTDIDRAFAYNCGLQFNTISEFLNTSSNEKFQWNNRCLSPDQRLLYIKKLSEYVNPNIFEILSKMNNSDCYLIALYGPPRSGKTTLVSTLVEKWRTSTYGKTHAVEVLPLSKLSLIEKTLDKYISVIVDGNCHTTKSREPLEKIANNRNLNILYIEVNPGIAMSYILNHVAVEKDKSHQTCVYPENIYYHYMSAVQRPKNSILYCPNIITSDEVLNYRY